MILSSLPFFTSIGSNPSPLTVTSYYNASIRLSTLWIKFLWGTRINFTRDQVVICDPYLLQKGRVLNCQKLTPLDNDNSYVKKGYSSFPFFSWITQI